ncbi:MAG: hypothetical protein KBA51_00035 [Kiritimatiellae bacterium]|nr:hypothetical protein [Kiritimatiellia bacterium]
MNAIQAEHTPPVASDPSSSPRTGAWMLAVAGALAVLWMSWHAADAPELFERASIGRAMAERGILRTEPLSFAASDQPWQSAHWLYDRAAALLAGQIGIGGLAWIHRLLAAICAGVWIFWGIRDGGRWAGIFAALLFLIISRFQFAIIGPEAITWGWATLLVFLLQSLPRAPALRWTAALIVQLAWANTAPYALLGPVLAAGWIADESIRGKTAAFRSSIIAVLAMVAVCAATPYGWGSLREIISSRARSGWPIVLEPGFLRLPVETVVMYLTLAVMCGCMLVRRQRLPILWLLAAGAGILMVVRLQASVATFALLCLPFVAISLDSIARWIRDFAFQHLKLIASLPAPLRFGLAAIAIGFLLWTPWNQCAWDARGIFRGEGSRTIYSSLSAGLCRALQREDAPQRLLHLPVDGGALAWARPGVPIFADTRSSDYPPEFLDMIDRWQAGDTEAFKAILLRWKPDGVLLRCLPVSLMPSHAMLASQPGEWALTYMDGDHALWIRISAVPESFARDPELHREGWALISDTHKEWSAARRSRGVSPRIIGAGAFLSTVLRNSKQLPMAASLFSLGARHAPGQIRLKYYEAIALKNVQRHDESRAAVIHYLKARNKDAQAWALLAGIETARGDVSAAKSAQNRADTLAPNEETNTGSEPTAPPRTP